MTAVTTITHLAPIQCPPMLRELRAWVVWKYEPNGDKKPRKVPWYARGGRRLGDQGSQADRHQLVTFAEARTAAANRGMDGVGFCPMADFNVVALDFDACVDAEGRVEPAVADLLSSTYAEYSPSGTGVRALFRGCLDNRKSHAKPGRFGFEVFSTNGFVTFTGNALPITEMLGNQDEVAPLDPGVLALYAERFSREIDRQQAQVDNPDRIGLTDAELRRALDCIPNDDLPYEADDGPSFLAVGMALHHETNGDGFDLWDEWCQHSSKYTSREYGWDRWRSFDRGTGPVITGGSLVKWANDGGAGLGPNAPASIEDFDVIADQSSPDAPSQRARFTPIPAADFAGGAAPRWIVKGVLPEAELVVLYGESTAGKSFIALQIGMAIARGVPWRGRRTRQGRVVHVVAEGAGGFRNRLTAYARHQELDLAGVPYDVIPDCPNLLLKPDALALAKAIGPASVVIVDTFAQTMPGGNENAGEDMGKALNHCKGIHRATGALVILVHHSGKDASRGARGWSGLRAAADAELEVAKTPAGRVLRTAKQKDGDDTPEWGFGLEVVELGIDEDGDPITSCVVVDAEVPAAKLMRPLGPIETVVNAVIQEMAQAQSAGIEVGPVLAEAARRLPEPEDGKRDTRKQRCRRALEALCNGDDAPYYLGDDGCLSLC